MTQRYNKRLTEQHKATSQESSTKHADASSSEASEAVLVGKKPADLPARVEDYEELEKKAIDVLIDALKYIATTSGIVIAVYSQNVKDYVKLPNVAGHPQTQLVLFSPLLLWFGSILASVLGIYPHKFAAHTDLEKEKAITRIRNSKRLWLQVALWPFILGFLLFLCILAAQIWGIYPFR
jgi:hypothetical protein